MVTKGILKTINYNNNTCIVRLPVFETSNTSEEVVLPAVFSIQPGIYNGYVENDVVFVSFEGNKLDSPVIIGKLYLGAAKETAKPSNSVISAANLNITSNSTIPLTTTLTFNNPSVTEVPVDNRYANYKSLLDIINALNKTEDSIAKVDKNVSDGVITEIRVEYLSQKNDLEAPTVSDPNWQSIMPPLEDGYDIWQKTTCFNNRGQVLGTPEIICLTSASAVFTYWLNISTSVHTGTNQKEPIVITAMSKIGTHLETEDTTASLKWKWQSEEEWKPLEDEYTITINATDCIDEDLIIEAYHGETNYETETITFIAQNGPTLDLDNDTAQIAYDSIGKNKLDLNSSVSSTATLYYNGKLVESGAKFSWELTNCTAKEGTFSRTIIIDTIGEDSDEASATCSVTYAGTNCSKTFTITKARQGNPGADGESVLVQNAFCWSTDYMYIPSSPDSSVSENTSPGTWDENTKDTNVWYLYTGTPTISKNSSTDIPSNGRIIFLSQRSGTESEITSAIWSKPEVFAVANESAYNILNIADGLFGMGQGVYYTYDPIEVTGAPNNITINGTPYNKGQPINATQSEIAEWIVNGNGEESPLNSVENRKSVIKLYINAEYIKTGALKVENETGTLFEAGLENNTVKIGGFDVSGSSLYTNDKASFDNDETGVYIGNDGIKLGDKFSVDTEGNVIAVGLRADKITVKDDSNNILLSANDPDNNTENKVTIGGFKVDQNSLVGDPFNVYINAYFNTFDLDKIESIYAVVNDLDKNEYVSTASTNLMLPTEGYNDTLATFYPKNSDIPDTIIGLSDEQKTLLKNTYWIATKIPDEVIEEEQGAAEAQGVILVFDSIVSQQLDGDEEEKNYIKWNIYEYETWNLNDKKYILMLTSDEQNLDTILNDIANKVVALSSTGITESISSSEFTNNRQNYLVGDYEYDSITDSYSNTEPWAFTAGKSFGVTQDGKVYAKDFYVATPDHTTNLQLSSVIENQENIITYEFILDPDKTPKVTHSSNRYQAHINGSFTPFAPPREAEITFIVTWGISTTTQSGSDTTIRYYVEQSEHNWSSLYYDWKLGKYLHIIHEIGTYIGTIASVSIKNVTIKIDTKEVTTTVSKSAFKMNASLLPATKSTNATNIRNIGSQDQPWFALYAEQIWSDTLITGTTIEGKTIRTPLKIESYDYNNDTYYVESGDTSYSIDAAVIKGTDVYNVSIDNTSSEKTMVPKTQLTFKADRLLRNGSIIHTDSTSDYRYKKDISVDLNEYNDFFDKLHPVHFKFKDNIYNRTHLGFIAQEVEQSLLSSNLTRKDFAGLIIKGEGFDNKTDEIIDVDKISYQLDYREFITLNTHQIQLLKTKVKNLEEKIESLEQKINNK